MSLTDADRNDIVCEIAGDYDPGLFTAIERIVTRARAEALREAATRVREFRDWYPTSVFPSLDEALSDDYEPSSAQIAAWSYRHAYGDLVPRNLRAWADEIEAD